MLKLLDQALINQVVERSRISPRLRCSHNFHDSHDEPVQRCLLALQPGTYVRPHRHLRPFGINGFELLLVLQGAIGLIVVDEDGQVIQHQTMAAGDSLIGVEIPAGAYHSLMALKPDTVLFEVKAGPYRAETDKDFLASFPQEGTLAATQQLQIWETLFL